MAILLVLGGMSGGADGFVLGCAAAGLVCTLPDFLVGGAGAIFIGSIAIGFSSLLFFYLHRQSRVWPLRNADRRAKALKDLREQAIAFSHM